VKAGPAVSKKNLKIKPIAIIDPEAILLLEVFEISFTDPKEVSKKAFSKLSVSLS